jgi:hypothetical protein
MRESLPDTDSDTPYADSAREGGGIIAAPVTN